MHEFRRGRTPGGPCGSRGDLRVRDNSHPLRYFEIFGRHTSKERFSARPLPWPGPLNRCTFTPTTRSQRDSNISHVERQSVAQESSAAASTFREASEGMVANSRGM